MTTVPVTVGDELVVDLEGFEGPISLLLHLARDQKVDLKQISILALADQYLAFIAGATQRLEVAGDYLVMAAWLAYLKSRLLLPDPPMVDDEEPTGATLAQALQWRLLRLESMQAAAKSLFERPLLGRDVFGCGLDAGAEIDRAPPPALVFAVGLHHLLRAYSRIQGLADPPVLTIDVPHYYSVDDALQRLETMLGLHVDRRSLMMFLPPHLLGTSRARSALAATFAASLELAKAGRIILLQEKPFSPIYLAAVRPGV